MGLDLRRRPRWRTIGASAAGTAHAAAGDPCADACAIRVFSGRNGSSLLVAVAADGAGTSQHAAEGARLACDAILRVAERWRRATRRPGTVSRRRRRVSGFGRSDVVRWVEAARRPIAEVAAARRLSPRAFSCTLLVALVDEQSAAFFQIGDGAIVFRDREGKYRPALWPQTGEYANCTWFVTDPDAADRVQMAAAPGVHEVALFTDGLQGLALRFASREAHAPFFAPLFAHLRKAPPASRTRTPAERTLALELRAFLDSAAVNQRTDDDKTLVLATRLGPSRPPPRRARKVRR